MKSQETNMGKTFAEAVQATRPTVTAPAQASSLDADRIAAILKSKDIKINAQDGTTIGAGDELFDSLKEAQKRQLQKIMSKLGYNAQGINELKTLLAAWYPTVYDSATNFSQLYTDLVVLPLSSCGYVQ